MTDDVDPELQRLLAECEEIEREVELHTVRTLTSIQHAGGHTFAAKFSQMDDDHCSLTVEASGNAVWLPVYSSDFKLQDIDGMSIQEHIRTVLMQAADLYLRYPRKKAE